MLSTTQSHLNSCEVFTDFVAALAIFSTILGFLASDMFSKQAASFCLGIFLVLTKIWLLKLVLIFTYIVQHIGTISMKTTQPFFNKTQQTLDTSN